MMGNFRVIIIIWLAALALAGCTGRPAGYGPYETPSTADRNPLAAQELTAKAAELIDTNTDAAEKLLRDALGHDLFYGPAHNDLGVVYLKSGKLYEAANEFEWARKLMPGHPDPRMNLAMTLERAGRIDDALATYDSALEVYPNHLPTIEALARCQLKNGKTDDRTAGFLKEIAFRSESDQWRQWAMGQMRKLEP